MQALLIAMLGLVGAGGIALGGGLYKLGVELGGIREWNRGMEHRMEAVEIDSHRHWGATIQPTGEGSGRGVTPLPSNP